MKVHLTDKGPMKCVAKSEETCTAKLKGEKAPHFDDFEAAQAFSDKLNNVSMHASFRKPAKKKSGLVTEVPLETIMDLDLLNRMVAEGYVRSQSHPDDPALKILNYSNTAQIEGKWNGVTKKARGLIIYSKESDFSDARIRNRPWDKFYTLQQMESGWSLGDEEEGSGASAQNELDKLDFDAPAEVTDKMDGSMGILYTTPSGDLGLTTKGSFKSDQALYYTAMMNKDGKTKEGMTELQKKYPNTTFIFELTGEKNQIVVHYDKDGINMIGAVDNGSGLYHSTRDFGDIWSPENGFSIAEPMPANSLREALALPNRENSEGVVVRFVADKPENQMMVKVKQADYLELHRVLTHMNPRKVFETTRDGSYKDFTSKVKGLSFFNGTLTSDYDKMHEMYMEGYAARKAKLDSEYSSISHIVDRKEFAEAAKKTSDPGYMFSSKDGKDTDRLLWTALEKQYKDTFSASLMKEEE